MRRLQFGSNRSYGIIAFNILLEDKKKGRIIPGSFPGTVTIVEDIDNNTLLHPEYRRYKDGYDADFEYFVTRLLAKLNPLRTNYRSRQKEDLISEILQLPTRPLYYSCYTMKCTAGRHRWRT